MKMRWLLCFAVLVFLGCQGAGNDNAAYTYIKELAAKYEETTTAQKNTIGVVTVHEDRLNSHDQEIGTIKGQLKSLEAKNGTTPSFTPPPLDPSVTATVDPLDAEKDVAYAGSSPESLQAITTRRFDKVDSSLDDLKKGQETSKKLDTIRQEMNERFERLEKVGQRTISPVVLTQSSVEDRIRAEVEGIVSPRYEIRPYNKIEVGRRRAFNGSIYLRFPWEDPATGQAYWISTWRDDLTLTVYFHFYPQRSRSTPPELARLSQERSIYQQHMVYYNQRAQSRR